MARKSRDTLYCFICPEGTYPLPMRSDAAAVAEAEKAGGVLSIEDRHGRVVWASDKVKRVGGRQLALI